MARLYAEAGWKAEIVVCADVAQNAAQTRLQSGGKAGAAHRKGKLKPPFVKDALKKKRGVRSQVGLNAQQRIENMQGAVLPGKHAGAVEVKACCHRRCVDHRFDGGGLCQSTWEAGAKGDHLRRRAPRSPRTPERAHRGLKFWTAEVEFAILNTERTSESGSPAAFPSPLRKLRMFFFA